MTSDTAKTVEVTGTFPSGGRTITVERYESDRDGPHPPVLLLHGSSGLVWRDDADRLVPASEARKLERLLKQHGRPYEMTIYPGQGHGFEGEASEDAVRRALAFLERHLKGE